jgi:hypothetical protein
VEECTYFWGVNTSWGIDTAESKGPLHQEDNQAPQPTLISKELVRKLGLKTQTHHKPYTLKWMSNHHQMHITK